MSAGISSSAIPKNLTRPSTWRLRANLKHGSCGSLEHTQADNEQACGGKCGQRRDRPIEAFGSRLPADREPAPILGLEPERGATALARTVGAVARAAGRRVGGW